MPRQFSLKTLLWLMAVVVAFFGGRATSRSFEEQRMRSLRLELEEKAEQLRREESRQALELRLLRHLRNTSPKPPETQL
jgi:hypothetical protein